MLELLPDPNMSPRCTDFTRGLDVDPAGTSITADVLVLVATPLPWPKPVFAHDLLREVESMPEIRGGRARVLAAVPGTGEPAQVVTTYWRTDGETRAAGHVVASAADLARLLGEIAADDGRGPSFVDETIDPPTSVLLVCTQGSHDVCCGTDGTRFAAAAEAAFDDLTVIRVSHTGGHRFAPTAMTLPDGRMWAHLDIETLADVLGRGEVTTKILSRCRGWWGAAAGPAQVAERAVFGRLGWAMDRQRRHVELAETSDGGWLAGVVVGERRFEVSVRPGRSVPTIACRQPGGLPAKPATEYVAELLEAESPGAGWSG